MDIKKVIFENSLKQWEIAELITVSEFTLSRWLRRPEKLTAEQRQRIEAAIQKLIEARQVNHLVEQEE